ncbi:MFS transporter [Embleya sp. NPDC005971]|uniref:MFS transporter n=1 Tax=Embleya sp. NPDC005971 TaxID=3156724 RepID=UPI0033C12911
MPAERQRELEPTVDATKADGTPRPDPMGAPPAPSGTDTAAPASAGAVGPVDGADATDRAGVWDHGHRALSAGVLISVGLVAFEAMGVVAIMPRIARRLGGLESYGWGLSALMLASILGAVAAGTAGDRIGPRRPLAVALGLLAAGCVLAGVAPTWWVFVAGRFVQGLGVGAIMGLAYLVIGRAYPAHLQARMVALTSSAWTLPALIGPVVAGTLADRLSWRWLFLLLPIPIVLAGLLTLPALRTLAGSGASGASGGSGASRRSRASGARGLRRLPDPVSSLVLALGTGLMIVAFEFGSAVSMVLLASVGAVVAVLAYAALTPAGTTRARRGLPAGVAMRWLLAGAYFGADTFLPLGLTELRGLSTVEAGLGLSAGALTWVAGSALQARWDDRHGARLRPTHGALGSAVLFLGIAILAGAVLIDAVPPSVAVAGWAIGGLGMGIAYNAASAAVLAQAPPEEQGRTGAALQLSQTFAVAVLSGLGGGALALTHDHGAGMGTALGVTFGLTALLALVAALVSGRIKAPAGG